MFRTQRGYREYLKRKGKYCFYKNIANSSKKYKYAATSMKNNFYRIDCLDIIECPENVDYSDEPLFEFLNKVVPETGYAYYIQRQMDHIDCLGKSVFFKKYKQRSDFINNLIFSTKQQEYTVFYSANSYIKDRGHTAKNERGLKAKSLIIDIDGIEGIENLNENNVEEYLKGEYLVSQEQLPNYICFSGHGLHLYYILSEEADNDEYRKEVHKTLVKLYSADRSCIPFCHCFRVPCSYNLKNNKAIQSRLYKTSNEMTYRIDEFSWADDILESGEYLEKIIINSEKSKKENSGKLQEKSQQKPDKKSEKILSEFAEKINDDIINFNKLEYKHHDDVKSRNEHLLIDLHNYYVRHNGLVTGIRHNFFMIMAYVLKDNKLSEEDAVKYIKKYISESHSFYLEAISDLNRVFAGEKVYHYKNETIADWLNFTQLDLKESYGFTDESKKEIERNNNKNKCKRFYERNRKNLEKEKLKNEMKSFIVEYGEDYKNKELAEMFCCSESTVKRLKNKIKNNK